MVYTKSHPKTLFIGVDLNSEEEDTKHEQTANTHQRTRSVNKKRDIQPSYKPIKADTNLLSAYSIKPQVKKDMIFEKTLINKKYTISKKA
jgi:hypothetical protein